VVHTFGPHLASPDGFRNDSRRHNPWADGRVGGGLGVHVEDRRTVDVLRRPPVRLPSSPVLRPRAEALLGSPVNIAGWNTSREHGDQSPQTCM
jgi:hypothetical protein